MPHTADGFLDPYNTPLSQPVPSVIRWRGTSRSAPKPIGDFANVYELIPEYEIGDLIPETPGGFPDPYDAEPVWLDSS